MNILEALDSGLRDLDFNDLTPEELDKLQTHLVQNVATEDAVTFLAEVRAHRKRVFQRDLMRTRRLDMVRAKEAAHD